MTINFNGFKNTGYTLIDICDDNQKVIQQQLKLWTTPNDIGSKDKTAIKDLVEILPNPNKTDEVEITLTKAENTNLDESFINFNNAVLKYEPENIAAFEIISRFIKRMAEAPLEHFKIENSYKNSDDFFKKLPIEVENKEAFRKENGDEFMFDAKVHKSVASEMVGEIEQNMMDMFA